MRPKHPGRWPSTTSFMNVFSCRPEMVFFMALNRLVNTVISRPLLASLLFGQPDEAIGGCVKTADGMLA